MSKFPVPGQAWLLEQCGLKYDIDVSEWFKDGCLVRAKYPTMEDLWEACKKAGDVEPKTMYVVIRETCVVIEEIDGTHVKRYWLSDYGSITSALAAALGWLKGWNAYPEN